VVTYCRWGSTQTSILSYCSCLAFSSLSISPVYLYCSLSISCLALSYLSCILHLSRPFDLFFALSLVLSVLSQLVLSCLFIASSFPAFVSFVFYLVFYFVLPCFSLGALPFLVFGLFLSSLVLLVSVSSYALFCLFLRFCVVMLSCLTLSPL
jgi:hypothetical protein